MKSNWKTTILYIIFSILTLYILWKIPQDFKRIFLTNKKIDVDKNDFIEKNVQFIPWQNTERRKNIIKTELNEELIDEDIEEFVYIEPNKIIRYSLEDGMFKETESIMWSNVDDMRYINTESTYILFDNLYLKNAFESLSIPYRGQILYTNNDQYYMDLWKLYCKFFIRDDCVPGNYDTEDESMGLIILNDFDFAMILESKNKTNQFPYIFTDNEDGIFTYKVNSFQFIASKDDMLSKFMYNYISYIKLLQNYKFISLNDHILHSMPYLKNSYFPSKIFLHYQGRRDLMQHKDIITKILDKNDAIELNRLGKLIFTDCAKNRLPTDTCKVITRLWFYLSVTLKMPQEITLTLPNINMSPRLLKMASLTGI